MLEDLRTDKLGGIALAGKVWVLSGLIFYIARTK
jgi:hypothetical protein